MGCELYSVLLRLPPLLLGTNKTFRRDCQMPVVRMQLPVEIAVGAKQPPPKDPATLFIKRGKGERRKVGSASEAVVLQHNKGKEKKKKQTLWLSWDFRILRFYFYKNGLICLRLLLSITAGSPGERWEAENSGNLPKEKSMKQINPSQAAMTQ